MKTTKTNRTQTATATPVGRAGKQVEVTVREKGRLVCRRRLAVRDGQAEFHYAGERFQFHADGQPVVCINRPDQPAL